MPEDSDMRRLYEAEQFLKMAMSNLQKHTRRLDCPLTESQHRRICNGNGAASRSFGNGRQHARKHPILCHIRHDRHPMCHQRKPIDVQTVADSIQPPRHRPRLPLYIFIDRRRSFLQFPNARLQCSSHVAGDRKRTTPKRLYHERILEASIAVCGLLLVVLVASVVILAKQKKRLSTARAKLKEANVTKDEYMGQFLELCSIYMKKLDSFTKLVYRKATLGQVDDLIK